MFLQIIAGIIIALFVTAVFVVPMLIYGGFWKGLGYLALVCTLGSIMACIVLWASRVLGF